MAERADFVIVGGGSAGSVLGNRLSADPNTKVVVLEAGHRDVAWDIPVRMPAALTLVVGNRFYDWKYESQPEPFLGGRRIEQPRGRVLGGSSSINGMLWQRGHPHDYDDWAKAPGMEAWDFAHCLPYFKRCETAVDAAADDNLRGHDGPLVVQRPKAAGPLRDAFFAAVQQAGYSLETDLNGFRQEGFGALERNIVNGERQSASRAYLQPVEHRRNLTVETGAMVTRVLFDGTRAVGVEYARGRRVHRIDAGEVILCGGAFNSPHLLQLSGVGPADELAALGIEPVADVRAVGDHLLDHMEVYIQYRSTQPVSLNPYLRKRKRPAVGLEWLLRRSGPGATNHFEAGGWLRTNEGLDRPNVLYVFVPLTVRYDGTQAAPGHGYQVHVMPSRSNASGSVRLVSRDPRVHPELRFNYMSTEDERREWLEIVSATREIFSQPAFAPFNGGEISPGPDTSSDGEVLDWVNKTCTTALHPAGSCRMGAGDDSAVDPSTLGVHGIDGVRVVDASVFPGLPNGCLYAPVIMVAEKAADAILGNTPLASERIDYYVPAST